MLLQRKFGAIPSQTHSPSLQGVQGIRMQSFIKAAFFSFPYHMTCCGLFLKRVGMAIRASGKRTRAQTRRIDSRQDCLFGLSKAGLQTLACSAR